MSTSTPYQWHSLKIVINNMGFSTKKNEKTPLPRGCWLFTFSFAICPSPHVRKVGTLTMIEEALRIIQSWNGVLEYNKNVGLILWFYGAIEPSCIRNKFISRQCKGKQEGVGGIMNTMKVLDSVSPFPPSSCFSSVKGPATCGESFSMGLQK